MIDLVFWSFALPPAILIPLAVGAKSLSLIGTVGRRVDQPGASPIALGPKRPAPAGSDLGPDFLDTICGFSPRAIEDEPSYRDAVAILDRLFNLDRRQTAAERRYFCDLAEKVYEYERMSSVIESSLQPSSPVNA
jgi:hypothetical protein